MPGTVLLSNSEGYIARDVLSLLHAAEIHVRALCRRWQDAHTLRCKGVEAEVVGAQVTSTELRSLLDGCTVLALVQTEQRWLEEALTAAAFTVRTPHIVQVVSLFTVDHGATQERNNTHSQMIHDTIHHDVLMQDLLTQAPLIRKGLLLSSREDAQAAWVDAADVARTVVQCITGAELTKPSGRYTVMGPEVLDMSQLARRLSHNLGHRVHHVYVPESWFRPLVRVLGLNGTMTDVYLSRICGSAGYKRTVAHDDPEVSVCRGSRSFNALITLHKTELRGFDIVPMLVAVLGLALSVTTAMLFMQ